VPGAEIQHVLGFLDTADQRTGQAAALEDQVEHRRRRVRAVGGADQGHGAVALEQVEERIQVVRRGHGVEDEVQAVGDLGHFVRVLRHHHPVGAQAQAVFAFVR